MSIRYVRQYRINSRLRITLYCLGRLICFFGVVKLIDSRLDPDRVKIIDQKERDITS